MHRQAAHPPEYPLNFPMERAKMANADPDRLAAQPRGTYAHFRDLLRHRLGVDKAIAFTILARGWASFAGLVTIALIARFLSPAEQGYYYTFGSLIALQIVFELGFSFVILQMASHERAHLTISLEGDISGSEVAHARLASVLQKTVRWYSVAALFLAAFLLSSGSWFFSAHHGGDRVLWQVPWYAAALAATLTFQLDPILSFMEGCGFVANVARLRFFQAALASLLAWAALASHHGLFAPAAFILGNAIGTLSWLLGRRSMVLALLRHNPRQHQIRWSEEVWPFQWRIALSWLCGYFIFQLYNPILFAFRGPVEAGQMGMSLNIGNALSSIAISWINTKAAPFGAMIARREFGQLDRVFFRALGQSTGVCAIGAFAVWLVILSLSWARVPFAQRVLGPVPLAIRLISTVLNVVVNGEALYLRAHKQEKFILISILGALLMSLSTYFLGTR